MLCIFILLVFERGQPRLALLFCWYHLPNVLLLYFTIIFHVILCYVFVFVFVNLNLNLVIKFIHSFNFTTIRPTAEKKSIHYLNEEKRRQNNMILQLFSQTLFLNKQTNKQTNKQKKTKKSKLGLDCTREHLETSELPGQ